LKYHINLIELILSSTVVSATPLADSKSFKIGVTSGGSTKYLQADGIGTGDLSKAVACTITGGALSCDGGVTAPMYTGDMVQLKLHKSTPSKGWTVDDTNKEIHWNGRSRKFSFRGLNKESPQIWAESCPHGHFPTHGSAKAYYA
jgi:hypothetical protein